jgi:hypothetical protein
MMLVKARYLIHAFGIALLVTALPSAAQTAEDALGRLFFTPERRAVLDRQRQSNIQEARSLQGETMRLDGVVQRSSGKHTVWINGTPQTETDAAKSGIGVIVNPRDPGKAELLPGEDSGTRMKVGEAINRSTGDRDTRLGSGSVVRHGGR